MNCAPVAWSPLITPSELAHAFPINDTIAQNLLDARREVEAILAGEDQRRLLVIVGPCSIHDPAAAHEYARRLNALREQYKESLCIVMRTYFEKPRTIVGWKGLINDPRLDGSFDVNEGLKLARKLLVDINEIGMPTATEFLDMVTGQYISDLITWGRHRRAHHRIPGAPRDGFGPLLPGWLQERQPTATPASPSMRCAPARHSHIFYSPDKDGKMTIYRTAGNPFGHVILRGGHRPNYDTASVDEACEALADVGMPERLVVDFSHGKQHEGSPPPAAGGAGHLRSAAPWPYRHRRHHGRELPGGRASGCGERLRRYLRPEHHGCLPVVERHRKRCWPCWPRPRRARLAKRQG